MGRRKSGKKSGKKSTPSIVGGRQTSNAAKKDAELAAGAAKNQKEGNEAPENGIDLRKIEKSPGEKAREASKGRKEEKPSRASGQPSKRGRGIGAAVFLPCLFIALVLGLYLGTLLPDMRAEMDAPTPGMVETPPPPNQREPDTRVSPPPPAASTAQVAPDGGLSSLLSRTTLSPGDARAWIELGNAYFDKGEARNAISAYRHALELAPDNADVMTDMGIMYRELGDYREAVNCFRRAREIDPRHLNAMFNEGVVQLNDLKNPTEARKAWEMLLRVNPEARSPDGKRVEDILRLLPNG